ncbi:uncharacterized protein LOC119604903 isoform X2 [Lucilia sericata]|uniref:uncharacterized protein LOC119604903 isoform X2 n=1 Tax=Lucilia sericata TaxID=13632 RepID=UPI0018A83CF0|nr:uncharacterized protein LOC119604903 isoform X2 [Lucilia sericata]
MSFQSSQPSKGNVTNLGGNTYCVVLNIAEGVGFDLNVAYNHSIILKVSLNGVLFEVVGNSIKANVITFNSNCIWECELTDIKRMKSDNRPVKLECFIKYDCYVNGSIKRVGSLLLPLRGLKLLHTLENLQIKPSWYKLSNSSPKGFQIPPQIYLMLSIVKKTLAEYIQFETRSLDKYIVDSPKGKPISTSNATQTQRMLQSQYGIFVKLLEDAGHIQIGNNPQMDCDIFCVTITFTRIKHLLPLLKINEKFNEIKKRSFVFQYDFLGSITNIDIFINTNDCYTINQKISLNFRSSLKGLRLYFQRIFYIPINLYYMNDIAIAKYDFNISPLLPEEVHYFNEKSVNLWTKCGSFHFDIFNNLSSSSPRQPPLVDFMVTLELITQNSKRNPSAILPTAGQLENAATEENGISQETKVGEYLHLYKNTFEEVALRDVHSEASNDGGTNFISNKSVCEAAVNTDDHFIVQEREKLYLHFLHEFEYWKEKQIRHFSNEMAHTKQEIRDHWEDYINHLIACLETKVLKCDKMFEQLEKTQTELNDIADISLKNATIADNITREMESFYRKKTTQFEMELECLRNEIQEKEIEKVLLKKRNDQLEKQLSIYQTCHLSIDQLKEVLNDMRNQANRFGAIECFYKEQCFDDMHKWKLKILKLLNERNFSRNFDF